jgi:RimJ/RimL family protein N-acetyltransferase
MERNLAQRPGVNNSSIHVAEVSGYERERLLRSHQEIGGTRRDMLLYATTRP